MHHEVAVGRTPQEYSQENHPPENPLAGGFFFLGEGSLERILDPLNAAVPPQSKRQTACSLFASLSKNYRGFPTLIIETKRKAA